MILIRSPSLENTVSRHDLKIYDTFCVCSIKYQTCSRSLFNYRNNAALAPGIMFILICKFGRKRQLSDGLNYIRAHELDHTENNAFVYTVKSTSHLWYQPRKIRSYNDDMWIVRGYYRELWQLRSNNDTNVVLHAWIIVTENRMLHETHVYSSKTIDVNKVWIITH